MNDEYFFMHRIRRTSGTFDKGIEVKDNFDAAKQAFHAQMAAWAYGHDPNTDFVSCMITDMLGQIVNRMTETWRAPKEPELEPEPEEEQGTLVNP